jgi:zinc protease
MRLAFYGYPDEYLSRYRQRLAAVTAGDVLAVARRHLHPEAQTLIMVGNPEQPDDIADALGLPLKTVDLEGFSSEGESN